MNLEDFMKDMEGSFKHKFAKKPEVIEGILSTWVKVRIVEREGATST